MHCIAVDMRPPVGLTITINNSGVFRTNDHRPAPKIIHRKYVPSVVDYEQAVDHCEISKPPRTDDKILTGNT